MKKKYIRVLSIFHSRTGFNGNRKGRGRQTKGTREVKGECGHCGE
jgi:hypothetical protein